ncbi:P-loop containing nucleoside triphosphate hydrolase protein [Lasiosphaeria ovina]|uniref:P-loop containing nucleoside triphosphate hydrolase protein n=1 Tax=Lasiosphaeria ovina TaxID=92902 RepID=A0AAE0TWP9_9PEZI|nr:P-loop containing nucleoside triphosphate hydrolase protein [Lasiosphaeria ovina]
MAPGLISDEIPSGDRVVSKEMVVTVTNGHATDEEDAVGKKVVNGDDVKKAGASEQETPSDSEKPSAETKTEGAGKEAEPQDTTMKCEIKHLDRRFDAKDEKYFEERKDDVEKPKQKDWWRLYAFCMVRHFNSDKELETTRLYVNPQPLRQLLKDLIGNYPGDPIDVDDVQIEAPYHPLFYFRKEIETEGLKRFESDEESLAQLKLLISWIKSHFEQDIAAYQKCITNELKAISYDKIWTLFPPKTIAHCKVLNQSRALRVTDSWYDDSDLPGFGMRTKYVDFDGERLGTRRLEMFIPKYQGTRELSQLSTMPLDLHEDAAEVREELLARGRKFETYLGQHYLSYNGIALKATPNGYARYNVSGRVMIDCKTYHRLDPNDSFTVKEMSKDETTRWERSRRRHHSSNNGLSFAGEERTYDKLSDEDAMLTNATVRGYSFTVKRFLEFFVDELFPIEWNMTCFDDLVLDPAVKKTVRALVSTHAQKRDTFDDIVKGKGQGLVCVLHGPPGVGKTLTAECVAEYVKRPLYMVSSGDLGTSSTDLDHQLTRIMDMTATWRAVLLIDEADVFLERRSLHDLHRNAMVSVFLRVLEYYGGILFLTTNRVTTFDDAFKSRIHIPIRYTDLSVESRMQIWRNFCKMVPGGVDINEKGLAILANHDLNGRQIKNAIKAAESLAAFDRVKLDLEQLLHITKIQATFEKDLTSLSGIDYTAPGETKKDADSRNMFL